MDNYDELFLERLRNMLTQQGVEWEEKRMFGGQCFMVDDKMCFGTYKGGIMARVGADNISELIKNSGTKQMVHNNRPMKDYVFIQSEGFERDSDLEHIISTCLSFNPLAKSSKRKKKK